MKNGFYSDPDFQTVRENAGLVAGGAATTSYAKFRSFAAVKLTRVNAHVVTAGTATDASTIGFDVYVGTASVATIPVGTNTSGVDIEVAVNVNANAKDDICVKSKADAAVKVEMTYEYAERFVAG